MKRNIGYYWVYGNVCFPENKSWIIAYWDGNYFWDDGDDFDESSYEKIDENQIIRTEDKQIKLQEC